MDQLLVIKMMVEVSLYLWEEPHLREGMSHWGKANVARSFLLGQMPKCQRLKSVRSLKKIRKEWKIHRKLVEVAASKALDQNQKQDSIKMNTYRKNNNKRNFLKSTIRYSNRPKKRLKKKKQKYKNWCRNCRKQRKESHKNQLLLPEFL